MLETLPFWFWVLDSKVGFRQERRREKTDIDNPRGQRLRLLSVSRAALVNFPLCHVASPLLLRRVLTLSTICSGDRGFDPVHRPFLTWRSCSCLGARFAAAMLIWSECIALPAPVAAADCYICHRPMYQIPMPIDSPWEQQKDGRWAYSLTFRRWMHNILVVAHNRMFRNREQISGKMAYHMIMQAAEMTSLQQADMNVIHVLGVTEILRITVLGFVQRESGLDTEFPSFPKNLEDLRYADVCLVKILTKTSGGHRAFNVNMVQTMCRCMRDVIRVAVGRLHCCVQRWKQDQQGSDWPTSIVEAVIRDVLGCLDAHSLSLEYGLVAPQKGNKNPDLLRESIVQDYIEFVPSMQASHFAGRTGCNDLVLLHSLVVQWVNSFVLNKFEGNETYTQVGVQVMQSLMQRFLACLRRILDIQGPSVLRGGDAEVIPVMIRGLGRTCPDSFNVKTGAFRRNGKYQSSRKMTMSIVFDELHQSTKECLDQANEVRYHGLA